MLRGREWTWALLVIGALMAFGFPVLEPLSLDRMEQQLLITGIGALILGVGLGRLPIGRE